MSLVVTERETCRSTHTDGGGEIGRRELFSAVFWATVSRSLAICGENTRTGHVPFKDFPGCITSVLLHLSRGAFVQVLRSYAQRSVASGPEGIPVNNTPVKHEKRANQYVAGFARFAFLYSDCVSGVQVGRMSRLEVLEHGLPCITLYLAARQLCY